MGTAGDKLCRQVSVLGGGVGCYGGKRIVN